MTITTVYLISGANRGIGRALTAKYLSRAHSTVIATVRDPSKSTSQSLESLPKGEGSKIIVLKLDSLSETDPKDVVAILPGYSISHIDVVIANAGVMKCNRVTEISAAEYREHQNVNVIGPLLLFQATWKLLQKASNPKFVVISSTLGSVGIGPTRNVPSGSYGASKASVNYLMRKLHFEHPELIALPICPGLTQTDMGTDVARVLGRKEASVKLEDSIRGVIVEIDGASRTTNGRFASHDHIDVTW